MMHLAIKQIKHGLKNSKLLPAIFTSGSFSTFFGYLKIRENAPGALNFVSERFSHT